MEEVAMYQMVVLLSMLFVSMLKTIGIYFVVREKGEKFAPKYILSAILGIFVGYMAFMPTATYSGTLIDIFMQAGYYALGANLMFDLAGKVVGRKEK